MIRGKKAFAIAVYEMHSYSLQESLQCLPQWQDAVLSIQSYVNLLEISSELTYLKSSRKHAVDLQPTFLSSPIFILAN